MQRYNFNVPRGFLVDSSGKQIQIESSSMNSTLGQKDIINIQLVDEDGITKYNKVPASYTARFLVDKDYANPGVPIPVGNTNWTNSTGNEYWHDYSGDAPSVVTFDEVVATLGTVGTLSAGQYGIATGKIYVRLADDANPETKAEDFILITVENAGATPLAIEASSDVFNLTNSWYDENTDTYRDPVLTDGELTFTVNSNTVNFYDKLNNASSVTCFAEVQFFSATAFVFKIKVSKYYCTNRLLTSGEDPLELVGVDVYTKAESDARYSIKADPYVAGNLIKFAVDGNLEDSTYASTVLARIPTVTQDAALDAANTPSGSNAFATMLDLEAFAGGLILKGDWNASTNSPDITGTTTSGWAYIVTVAGATDLGGITDWQVGDWAAKTDSGWAKIDNSETYKVKLNVDDVTPGYLQDKLTSGDINSIKLNVSLPTPSQEDGLIFWDEENDCLAYMTDTVGCINQVGFEYWVRVYNNTGSTITNGQACYINGAFSGFPTVGLASAAAEATCKSTIGIATSDIPNASYGRITRTGVVNDLDTSSYSAGTTIYLSDTVAGNFTATAPTNPDSFTVYIGHVVSVDLSTGRIFVDTNVTNESDVNELKKLNADSYLFAGMKNKTDTTISINTGTLEVSVAPAVDMFDVYIEGERYIYDSVQTVSFTDTEGLWYIYFDSTGLKATQSYSPFIYTKYAAVTIFYWNATGNAILVDYIDERHGINMDGTSHLYLHTKVGAFCRAGCGITNLILSGGGSLDTHAQFGVATGFVVDEDIESTTYTVASTVGYPVLYLSGTSWRVTNRTGFGFLNDGGTGRVAYNSSGTQVSAADNTFVLVHVFGTNGYNNSSTNFLQGIVCIQGQASYATLALASTAAQTEIKSIVAYGLPLAEMAPLATLILQTRDVYTNSVNAQFVATIDGKSYIDWRGVGIKESAAVGGGGTGGGGGPVAATDVTVDDSSFTNITGTNAQDVFDSIDDLMGTLGTGAQQTLTDNITNYYIACTASVCRSVLVAWYITDNTNYQYYRTRMIHNGSTVYVSSDYTTIGTEFTPAKVAVDGDIDSGNVRLTITLSGVGSNLIAVLKTVSTLKVSV